MILLGGNDAADAVTRMMRLAWGKEVCELYNWTGKNKEYVISETK